MRMLVVEDEPTLAAQLADALRHAGYTVDTEIELEHHRGYDVKADNPQGQRVKLRVDAQSGAVLRSRIKD